MLTSRVNREALRVIIVRIRRRLRFSVVRISVGRLGATVRLGQITLHVVELSTRDGNARGALEERHIDAWMSREREHALGLGSYVGAIDD